MMAMENCASSLPGRVSSRRKERERRIAEGRGYAPRSLPPPPPPPTPPPHHQPPHNGPPPHTRNPPPMDLSLLPPDHPPIVCKQHTSNSKAQAPDGRGSVCGRSGAWANSPSHLDFVFGVVGKIACLSPGRCPLRVCLRLNRFSTCTHTCLSRFEKNVAQEEFGVEWTSACSVRTNTSGFWPDS